MQLCKSFSVGWLTQPLRPQVPDCEPEQLEGDWQARLGQFLQQHGGTLQHAYVIRWALNV